MSEFDDFFKRITGIATRMFLDTGEHLPLFYLQKEPTSELVLLPAAWRDLDDKARKFITIRAMLDLGIFDHACLVHEMWFANLDMPERAALDVRTMTPPSQRPDRKEMLMMVALDRTQHRFQQWEIKRRWSRKPTLMPFQSPGRHDDAERCIPRADRGRRNAAVSPRLTKS